MAKEFAGPMAYAHQSHEPLLGGKEEEVVGPAQRFTKISSVIGLLIGLFIQISTLGANRVLTELNIPQSRFHILLFSFLWSVFTSGLAMAILVFLRQIVSLAFHARNEAEQAILNEMVLLMECHFVFGALAGVCFAWIWTDIMLGLEVQLGYSLLTLVVSFLWVKAMTLFLGKPDQRRDEPSNESGELVVV